MIFEIFHFEFPCYYGNLLLDIPRNLADQLVGEDIPEEPTLDEDEETADDPVETAELEEEDPSPRQQQAGQQMHAVLPHHTRADRTVRCFKIENFGHLKLLFFPKSELFFMGQNVKYCFRRYSRISSIAMTVSKNKFQ